MRTFGTDKEFTGAIDSSLQSAIDSADLRRAIAEGIGIGDADARDDPALDDGGLNLRLNRFILRDQDIPMTELIGIVAAAATAALVPGAIVAGALVTAVSSFAALAWKAWRKGAKLSKPEIAVLGFLEVQGPMTLDELKAKAPAALGDVTAVDVERAIQTLQDVELRDGDIVSLIRMDAAGLWRARPV
jgi:hypothetical protein